MSKDLIAIIGVGVSLAGLLLTRYYDEGDFMSLRR